MYGLEGWKATSKMLSSNFFLCAVISWTHVLLSRFHSLKESPIIQEVEKGENEDIVGGESPPEKLVFLCFEVVDYFLV